MLELSGDTLVVFVSDSHIGGSGLRRIRVAGRARGTFRGACGQGRARRVDPGGDFFDFLQIGKVEAGKNRASMTVERPSTGTLRRAQAVSRGGGGSVLSICRGTTTRSRSGTRRSRRRCASGDSSTSLPTTIWLPSRRAGAAGGLPRARQPVRPRKQRRGLPRSPGYAAGAPRRDGRYEANRALQGDLLASTCQR